MGADRPELEGLSRRDFLGTTAAGALAMAAASGAPVAAAADGAEAALAGRVAKLSYLTPPEQFKGFVREKPPVYELPAAKLREVGLDRETWQLEVVPEGEKAKVERPLTKASGTALTWPGLMELAGKHAVRFIHVLSCTNVDEMFGVGLWEGVPLREVVALARPTAGVRRVWYHGYHNDEAKQRFISSLTLARVMEDPPGELPVILAYKVNGQFLPAKLGGPVRMIVPGGYGNKNVKWLQRVVLTSSSQANDTYAEWNNDTESPMKSVARFVQPPGKVKAGEAMALVGVAQVGMNGLSKVQVAVQRQDGPVAEDDPYLTRLEWQEAKILPPPQDWGGGLPEGKLPEAPLQFDAAGRPKTWPLRYAVAQWAVVVKGVGAGRYWLRCRAVDGNGVAQPLPRPMARSGNNGIQKVELVVEG